MKGTSVSKGNSKTTGLKVAVAAAVVFFGLHMFGGNALAQTKEDPKPKKRISAPENPGACISGNPSVRSQQSNFLYLGSTFTKGQPGSMNAFGLRNMSGNITLAGSGGGTLEGNGSLTSGSAMMAISIGSTAVGAQVDASGEGTGVSIGVQRTGNTGPALWRLGVSGNGAGVRYAADFAVPRGLLANSIFSIARNPDGSVSLGADQQIGSCTFRGGITPDSKELYLVVPKENGWACVGVIRSGGNTSYYVEFGTGF
ncbi:MAG: hypothetical protein ABIF01_04230 [Candidatus Micrarchaeota archaeon]